MSSTCGKPVDVPPNTAKLVVVITSSIPLSWKPKTSGKIVGDPF